MTDTTSDPRASGYSTWVTTSTVYNDPPSDVIIVVDRKQYNLAEIVRIVKVLEKLFEKEISCYKITGEINDETNENKN